MMLIDQLLITKKFVIVHVKNENENENDNERSAKFQFHKKLFRMYVLRKLQKLQKKKKTNTCIYLMHFHSY